MKLSTSALAALMALTIIVAFASASTETMGSLTFTDITTHSEVISFHLDYQPENAFLGSSFSAVFNFAGISVKSGQVPELYIHGVHVWKGAPIQIYTGPQYMITGSVDRTTNNLVFSIPSFRFPDYFPETNWFGVRVVGSIKGHVTDLKDVNSFGQLTSDRGQLKAYWNQSPTPPIPSRRLTDHFNFTSPTKIDSFGHLYKTFTMNIGAFHEINDALKSRELVSLQLIDFSPNTAGSSINPGRFARLDPLSTEQCVIEGDYAFDVKIKVKGWEESNNVLDLALSRNYLPSDGGTLSCKNVVFYLPHRSLSNGNPEFYSNSSNKYNRLQQHQVGVHNSTSLPTFFRLVAIDQDNRRYVTDNWY